MSKKRILWVVTVVLVCLSLNAFGLTYWQSDWDKQDPNGPPTSLDTPNSNCFVRLDNSNGATATIIAPNFIITAEHWLGDGVNFKGETLELHGTSAPTDIYLIVDSRDDVAKDLEVCRVKKVVDDRALDAGYDITGDPQGYLEDVNFSNYVGLYDKTDEVGKELTFCSYGPQRLVTPETVNDPLYSEETIEVPGGTLHYGKNIASSTTSSRVLLEFDAVNDPDYIEYEVYAGLYDSGSGWFIKDGSIWKIASLYYTSPTGSRISSYVDWIREQIEDMGGVCSSSLAYNTTQSKMYGSIQDAIDDAVTGDVIELEPITYYENIDFKGKAITVTSSDPYDWDVVASTIIDVNNLTKAVTFESSEDANSIITGLTVTGYDYYGIYCYETSPTISNCIIDGADWGSYGVSSYTTSASPTIKNCVIKGSTYGIYTKFGHIVNCKIYDNWSSGIYCVESATVSIVNNLIYGTNSAGISVSGSPSIINNTIFGNGGFGIESVSGTPTPLIYNCIIAGNGTDGTDNLDSGFTAYSSYVSDTDPGFVDAANDDYSLSSSATGCIDAGDNTAVTESYDIDGNDRIVDGPDEDADADVDIGCYEYQL